MAKSLPKSPRFLGISSAARERQGSKSSLLVCLDNVPRTSGKAETGSNAGETTIKLKPGHGLVF